MHFHQLKRREFITLLGGAAAWPLAARANLSREVTWQSLSADESPWGGYMKKFFSFALALLTTSIVSALAQTYPTRTITIVIAFPPGGPNDGVVRFLAEKLTPSLGQAVIIENRPGGAGGTDRKSTRLNSSH